MSKSSAKFETSEKKIHVSAAFRLRGNSLPMWRVALTSKEENYSPYNAGPNNT